MLKRVETSDSWKEFVKELQLRCKEQEVSLSDFTEWIRDAIKQIERKEFHYYITSGKTEEFPEQKIDVNILLGNCTYGFTIFKDSKEYRLYPLKHLVHFMEELSGDIIRHYYHYPEDFNLVIEDTIANSAKLRRFAHQVLNTLWEMK